MKEMGEDVLCHSNFNEPWPSADEPVHRHEHPAASVVIPWSIALNFNILVQLLHLLVYRRACRFFSSIVGDSRASWIHLSQSCVRQPRARTSVVGGIVSLGEEVRGRLAISSYLISRVYIEPCLTDLTVDSRIPHARLRVGRQGMPRAK